MEEAASMASASCLRALFAALLVFNVVANPLALWERFKEDMAEYFLYQARQVGAQLCLCMALHVSMPWSFAWSWFACCAALNAHYVVCVLLLRVGQAIAATRCYHPGHGAAGVGAAVGTPQQQPGLGSIWLANACGPACQCCGGKRNCQV